MSRAMPDTIKGTMYIFQVESLLIKMVLGLYYNKDQLTNLRLTLLINNKRLLHRLKKAVKHISHVVGEHPLLADNFTLKGLKNRLPNDKDWNSGEEPEDNQTMQDVISGQKVAWYILKDKYDKEDQLVTWYAKKIVVFVMLLQSI